MFETVSPSFLLWLLTRLSEMLHAAADLARKPHRPGTVHAELFENLRDETVAVPFAPFVHSTFALVELARGLEPPTC